MVAYAKLALFCSFVDQVLVALSYGYDNDQQFGITHLLDQAKAGATQFDFVSVGMAK